MSLRSALAAFGNIFRRKKSTTPLSLRDALEEFARAVTPQSTKQSISEQKRTLTKLAQRMLLLSSTAAAEDRKVIAGACTLLAGALTRRVRRKAWPEDDDWLWLARWPALLLDSVAGNYGDAEALVRYLLELSWSDLLSPGAVHVLLERLNELPDAPDMPSPQLMSLYEQYCSRRRKLDKAAYYRGEEHDSVEPALISAPERATDADARREDEEIAAAGIGISADSAETFTSEMDASMNAYVPADDDADNDSISLVHEHADIDVVETNSASAQIGISASSVGAPDPDIAAVQTVADEPNENRPVSNHAAESANSEQTAAGDASHDRTEAAEESFGLFGAFRSFSFGARKRNDDAEVDKGLASAAANGTNLIDDTESAAWSATTVTTNEEQAENEGLVNVPIGTGGNFTQLPLPEIEVSERAAAGDAQPLQEADWTEMARAPADALSARDDKTVDMFDELEATVAGDTEDAHAVDAVPAAVQAEAEDAVSIAHDPDAHDETKWGPGGSAGIDETPIGSDGFGLEDLHTDSELQTALGMLDKHLDAEPDLDDILDAFDGTSVDDDKAIDLDGFVLGEEEATASNDDVPIEPESDDDVRSDIVAGVIAAVDPEEADEHAAKSAAGSLSTSSPDKKLSRATLQIVEVMLAELPEVEAELSICVGAGESGVSGKAVVGEAAQRCAEVLKRYASAADSVGFVGLARTVEIARERVLSVACSENLSDAQVRLLSDFTNAIRAYFKAPYSPHTAQLLLDWINDDGWATPAAVDETEVLLSLLSNPDLSAIDEDTPGRPQRANPEDISLAIPADANRELLDGLLQELPLQCEEFSAAIERMVNGAGTHEDLLTAQRIAHTIKGSGNTVGIRGLAALTHNIEDILLVLAQKKQQPSRPLADMLMNAADRLQAMTESLLGMGPPPDDALDVLQSVLDWANLIDREGLPPDDAAPESLPASLVDSKVSASAAAVTAASVGADRADAVHKQEVPGKADEEHKSEQELEALLRVPARLIDQMLNSAGESIILTGQLRDRVRRSLTDLRAMFAQFERQQQLGSELEELIDVKDFSRRQGQHDSRFDALEMDQYNELHSATRQLVENATDAREMGRILIDHLSKLDEMLISQEGLNRDTQDAVLHTRMVEVKSVFPRLKRAVRQTSRATDKKVELHLTGGETPMDSEVLNHIVDPLMHLLRNAIDHGIEDAATRLRNGKAATGNVYLDFRQDGNNIAIRCQDDGAGLDYGAIYQAAEERGLIEPDASADVLKQVILRANFSTRSQATQVSGRGIGLDVVHNGVSALGGTMTVDSEVGQGCCFEIQLPFNMISSHALLVRAGPNVVALASRGVEQIVHGRDGELQHVGDKTVFQIDEAVYPATTLETAIGVSNERIEGDRHPRPIVLTRTDEGVTAVSVEAVIGSRDLVVKSLGKYLPKLHGVIGATILGDGQVASVIDLPDLLSKRAVGVEDRLEATVIAPTGRNGGYVLVVDDSLSARRALAQFMEDSGYRVRSARDGVEAAEIADGIRPDLVLADLEMPRMNGIELTAHLRSNEETADVPVIMVTSRSTEKHREQAQAAGVNVYFTKPYSEDALIETVRSLIDEHGVKRRERPAA